MKVFNEEQSAEILKKAAANSHKNTSHDAPGLTVDELEQIASDSGIDPAEINKAVAAIALGHDSQDKTFWGGPFSFFEEVYIDHEISGLAWEKMLVLIRDFFKSKGEIDTRESVFEWSSPWGSTNTAQVTALKEQGKTKISVSWSGPMTAVPFYLPIPLVGIASLVFASEFLELGAVPGLLFVLLAMVLTFFAGRWTLGKQMDKGFSKLHDLTATLQHVAENKEEVSVSKEVAERSENRVSDTEVLLDVAQNEVVKAGKKRTRRSRA